jgi:Mrp family chromosome partitioning ATPase
VSSGTPKRPRFGDAPSRPGTGGGSGAGGGGGGDDDDPIATRVGAPLPLLTQPMAAISPRELADAGRMPERAVSPRQLAHTVPHDRPERMPTSGGAMVASPQVDLSKHQPPEIGLTQHHLPDDAPIDPRLVLVAEPDSERAASFRVLRHHLLDAGRPQVVAVSSPRAGDGKTTCAINLALALAECGRAKVLLVETHVRHPQLASLFRFVPPWCFAEQLAAHRHQPMLPWGLVDIPQLWLHVAAINPRIEQSQLLDAPAFAIAMERLRLGGYDHIVIDCPPVVGSADVNLIQDAADGTVLVVRGKRTTARDLRGAIEQLSPARVLGTVLVEG